MEEVPISCPEMLRGPIPLRPQSHGYCSSGSVRVYQNTENEMMIVLSLVCR